MMRPWPCSTIYGATACAIRNGPLRFTPITRSQASGGMVQKSFWLPAAPAPNPPVRALMPALFTRICTPPISAATRPTAASTDSGLVTSATMGSTASSPPTSRRSLAVRSSHSALTSSIATRAPARTRAAVMERPIPMGLPAPVTMAIRPCSVSVCVVIVSCLLFEIAETSISVFGVTDVDCRGRITAQATLAAVRIFSSAFTMPSGFSASTSVLMTLKPQRTPSASVKANINSLSVGTKLMPPSPQITSQ